MFLQKYTFVWVHFTVPENAQKSFFPSLQDCRLRCFAGHFYKRLQNLQQFLFCIVINKKNKKNTVLYSIWDLSQGHLILFKYLFFFLSSKQFQTWSIWTSPPVINRKLQSQKTQNIYSIFMHVLIITPPHYKFPPKKKVEMWTAVKPVTILNPDMIN